MTLTSLAGRPITSGKTRAITEPSSLCPTLRRD